MNLIPIKDKEHLLNYSRNIIKNNLLNTPLINSFIPESCKKAYGGAFVTIYVNNKLRGCIGNFTEKDSLIYVIKEMSVAVLHDSRFEPISIKDLDNLKIEISILSPLLEVPIDFPDFELGKHGLVAFDTETGRSGTYLPHVATEQGWTKEQFFGSLIREKAQITNNLEKIKLYSFETDKF